MQISLRPAGSGDLSAMYQMAVQYPHLWQRVCGESIPPPHHFGDVIWHNAAAVLVVVGPDHSECIGVCSIHSLDGRNDTAKVEFVLPRSPGLSADSQVATWLIDYAFRNWRLRKLYCEYADYGPSPVASIGEVVSCEGMLKDHVFHDNAYWDQIVLAIFRDDWMSARADYLQRFGVARQ